MSSNGSENQPPDDEEVEFQTFVTNEFTSVRVRKVRTRNGERLEIESCRLPHSIRLDALVRYLESLEDESASSWVTRVELDLLERRRAEEPIEDEWTFRASLTMRRLAR